MRCENKPLLQDDAGFLQEITPIAVEVGLKDAGDDFRDAPPKDKPSREYAGSHK